MAGQRFQRDCGVPGVGDVAVAGRVQRSGAGDEHEPTDDAGQRRRRRQRRSARRRRSASDRRWSAAYDWMKASPHGARVVPTIPVYDDQRPVALRHLRDDDPSPRLRPQSGCASKAGADVGDEDRGEQQQHVLDAMEAPARRTTNDHHSVAGNGEIPADPGKLEASGDTRELGACSSQVRDDERHRLTIKR